MAEKNNDVKNKINRIETTNEYLSSRAGLSLVVPYIKSSCVAISKGIRTVIYLAP